MSGSGISWAIRKFATRSRQITTPAPHHFYCPDALPAAQPKVSKHWIPLPYSIQNTPTDLADMSSGVSPFPASEHQAVMLTGWECFRLYRHCHWPSPGHQTRTIGSVAAVVARIWPVGSQWRDVTECCKQTSTHAHNFGTGEWASEKLLYS